MINSDKSFALFQRDEYIRQKHNIVAVLLKKYRMPPYFPLWLFSLYGP